MTNIIKDNSCSECEDKVHFNPFEGGGQLLDTHLDIEIDIDDLNQKVQEAFDLSTKLGGNVAGGMEQELGQLSNPQLTWQDFLALSKNRKKELGFKNNWNSPKRKPLFYGMYVPKKNDYEVKFLLAYDCSGSMSKDQISYGISQVAALNGKGEGYCIPWDAKPYFENMVKLKNASLSELRNARYKGGGGTVLMPLLTEYSKQIGDVDILIIVSDFYISDILSVIKWQPPADTQVIWLSVNGNAKFTPVCGRIFRLL